MVRQAARTVLVVDDDRAYRDLVSMTLADEETLRPVRVMPASGADEALLLLRTARPDLVLLDLRMPVLDGFEMLRRLRADVVLRTVPVVAVSALGPAEEVRARALAAGAVDFLGKPFELESLVAVAARWLRAGDGPAS